MFSNQDESLYNAQILCSEESQYPSCPSKLLDLQNVPAIYPYLDDPTILSSIQDFRVDGLYDEAIGMWTNLAGENVLITEVRNSTNFFLSHRLTV